jgi:hypothetical protein
MEWIRSIVGVGPGFGIFAIGSYMPRGRAVRDPRSAPPTLGLVAGSVAYGAVFAALGWADGGERSARRPVAARAGVAVLHRRGRAAPSWLEPGTNPRWLDISGHRGMATEPWLAGMGAPRVAPPR